MILSQLDSGTFKGITPRPVTCLCPKPILLRGLVKTHRNTGPYPLPLPFANFIDPSLKLKSYRSPPPPKHTLTQTCCPVSKSYLFSVEDFLYVQTFTRKKICKKGKLNKTVIKQRVEIFIRWKEGPRNQRKLSHREFFNNFKVHLVQRTGYIILLLFCCLFKQILFYFYMNIVLYLAN